MPTFSSMSPRRNSRRKPSGRDECGNRLTRENVMKQAANLKDSRTTNLLPGITIHTSPIDFAPIKQVQLKRFKEEIWELFGAVLRTEFRWTQDVIAA
jgi:hypothetical protein